MKFRLGMMAVLGAVLMMACHTVPDQNQNVPTPPRALGVLEINFDSGGISSAKFEPGNTRSVTFREVDAVFGLGTTNVISSVNNAFDYLVATFPVSHAVGSASAFQNLTLYALAKAGNVGDTAIKNITNFGGATGIEQTRLAKLLIPVHALKLDGIGNVVMDNAKADFQAFTSSEVSTTTTAAASIITAADTVLNYGFAAHCLTGCSANSRNIPTNGTGSITIAIRVPKAATSTTYKFVMNFVVMDESVSRVTRGVFPPERVSAAEARGLGVGATDLMQFGLNRGTTILNSNTVNDVNTSKLGASIHALGIGRISAGWQHSCGLTSSGAAYCWGINSSGELGDGSTIGTSYPVMVATSLTFSSISAGWQHTCGLTLSGAAYCWGRNTSGQLGDGNNANLMSLVPVAVVAPTGGNFLGFSSISASLYHTCGLALNGTAYCWGGNSEGQFGNNSTGSSNVPVIVNAFLTFSSITTGTYHTCGLTLSGATYCWGRNSSGELGNNSTTNSNAPVLVAAPQTFSSVTAGDAHTCALGLNGEAYCWGRNIFGELGDNSTTNSSAPLPVATTLTFSSIKAGGTFSCGLTLSGAAHCWGGFSDGELGNGFFGSSSVPVAVVAPAGGNVLTFSSISAGFAHSCGLTSRGTAYCWGRNGTGQLGDSSTSNKNVPVAVGNFNYSL
jgi:alpha-tubulin suppressor-like RCC1 family protein